MAFYNDESAPNRSRSPSEERSHVIQIDSPATERQEYGELDKVLYENKIWEIKQMQWNDKKKIWKCKLQLEDGSETKVVLQKKIEDTIIEGPNHPRPA